MDDATNLVVHDIDHTDCWPTSVTDIWRSLSYPLPKGLASNDVQQRLSPGVCDLYQEALQSLPVALEDQAEIESSGRAVTDVIDTILSCSRMVRAARSFGSGIEESRSGWISALTILGIAVADDALILEDARFLKARTMHRLKLTDVSELEGRAAILLSSYISSPAADEDDAMDIDEDEAEEQEEQEEEQEEEESDYAISAKSKESTQQIDLPHDAHVLPGRGRRMNCLLPVVCAATEDEIEDLLTSVLCQRYVLNTTLPVVGVSLPKFGTTAKIVIGWTEEEDAAPTVHLAYAHQNVNPHPSIGVFDLMDPASALCFAQFILRLRSHFSLIRPSMEDLTTRNFCWRLDHIDYDHGSRQVSRTETWVRGLYSAEVTGPSSEGHISSAPMPPNSNQPASSKNAKSSKKPRLPGGSAAGTPQDTLLNPPVIALPVADGSASGSKQAKPAVPSIRSASELAKLTPLNLEDMNPGTETWLWERNTLRLHRFEIARPASGVETQINEMIEKYNRFTRVCWPENWKEDNLQVVVPNSDAAYEDVRTNLIEDFTAYKTQNASGPTPAMFSMESDVWLSITSHISSLFKAVVAARNCAELARIGESPEAAMRSVWDDLFRMSCCEPKAAISDCFFVEKVIPLPRNKVSQLGTGFNGLGQAKLLSALAIFQTATADASEAPKAVQVALTSVVSHAKELRYSGRRLTQTEEERNREPPLAVVDGACCLRLQGQAENAEEAERWWLSSFYKRFTAAPECEGRKSLPPGLSLAVQNPVEDVHFNCYMCRSVVPPAISPSQYTPSSHLPLFTVPFIFAEYKKNDKSVEQAFHQVQMYLTFGLEFLAALGLMDYPLWGLVTVGTRGTIVMAWKSTKSSQEGQTGLAPTPEQPQYNFIVDRFTQVFDLTNPLDALQLMAVLHRLYKTKGELQEQLKAILDANPILLSHPSAKMKAWMPPIPKRQKNGKEAKVAS